MMCEICGGSGKVDAIETARGWRCRGLNGEAKCNRPKNVQNRFDGALGMVRVGQADCPLCTRRTIEKTSTDDHGWTVPFDSEAL